MSCQKVLRALGRAKTSREQRAILRKAPDSFIRKLVTLSRRILLTKRRKFTSSTYKKLYRKRKQLHRLACCTGPKGVTKARRQLNQRGGLLPLLPLLAGILPVLGKAALGAAAGVAGTQIAKAINKKINK